MREPAPHTLDWFLNVARAEGVSLLLLFGVAMPLKYAAGMPGMVAWVGGLHGALFLLYLVALGSAGRVEGWSWARLAGGFAAAWLPFGTFAFERSLRRSAL